MKQPKNEPKPEVKQKLVTLAMSVDDLAKLDEAAQHLRMSRASFIRMALFSETNVTKVLNNKE